jgi:glycosyltransferase involved in cell wall biosynthesis
MCLHLAREQLRRGHDVHVHCFEAGAASAKAQELGIPLSLQNVTTYSRKARWGALAHGLKRTLQTHPPDLVHSHVPITNLICHRVAPSLKIPWVATAHGSWRLFAYAPQTVDKPWLKPFLLVRHAIGDRITLRSAAGVAAISEYVKRELRQIGVPEKKMMVVHDGLPTNAHPLTRAAGRSALGLPDDALIIGSLGFFSPVKGFDLLIHAFAKLATDRPKLMLLIAGGDVFGHDEHRQELIELIEHYGLAARIQLLGALDPKAGFLAALDIFVVASRSEGLSLSLVEAMQHGKPSIVSSAGGSLEAARPEREALVFRSGDVDDLVQNLERLLSSETLRTGLGHAAQERAATYLTIGRCADDYDNFYTAFESS